MRKVLPQGSWLLPGLADLSARAGRLCWAWLLRARPGSRLSLGQSPEAESHLFHLQHTQG